MSVTQFPALAQEVATAMQMAAAGGNEEVLTALQQALEVMNTSYLSCSEELEVRIPPRASLEDVGLVETATTEDLGTINDSPDEYDGVE